MTATTILVGPEDPQRLDLIRSGQAPRLDYRLVAEHCAGTVVQCCPSPALLPGPKIARLVRSLAGNAARAATLTGSLPRGTTIYSTGETWGLSVAVVGGRRKRCRDHAHVMYAHRVYSPLWLFLLAALRPLLQVDGWICATQHQTGLLRRAFGSGHGRVEAISQGVDTCFFDPGEATPRRPRPYVLSVGTEMRDYSLLFRAVRHLDMQFVVKLSSAWMTRSRQPLYTVPSNVTVLRRHIPYCELRDLYAGASLVVLPLRDTSQAAGMSTILEAMALAKCVIATQSRGLPDGIVDGFTGLIAKPSPTCLAEAIAQLLNNPEQAAHLAENGYHWVREHVSLEAHALAVGRFIASVSEPA